MRVESALDVSRCSAFSGRRMSEEVVTFYEKPKKIINSKLLDSSGRLIPNLVEHYDFVVVDNLIWKHLSRWYGFDQQVCRRLIPDSGSQLKLDLYPDELIKKQINSRYGQIYQGTIQSPKGFSAKKRTSKRLSNMFSSVKKT
jgi:hypothetical protein